MELDSSGLQFGKTERSEEEIDLRQTIDILVAGRWSILRFVLIFTLLGLAYAFLKSPRYEADGRVQVEQDQKGLATATHDIESLLLGESTETEAEIQILQSRLVLEQVIDKLNLEISVKPKFFPLIGGAIYRARSDLEAPADPVLGLSSFAWGGEQLEITRLEVPAELLNERLLLRTTQNDGYELFDKHDEKLISGKVGEKAEAKTSYGPVVIFVQNLVARPGTEFRVEKRERADVLEDFSSDFKVLEEGKKSGVIALTLKGDSPKGVTAVLRDIEEVYIRQNIARRSEEAGQSLEYLQQQLPVIKEKVDIAQAKLNQYQASRGSVDVTRETQLILQQLVDLETQRLALDQQRQEALQRFTPRHPVVQGLDAQMAEIERKQAEVKKRSELLPQTQQDVLQYQLDVDANSALYETLLNTVQQLQVAKAGTVGDVRIIDYPLTPYKAASPKKPLVVALAIVAGLFIGMIVVYLQRVLIRGVDQPEVVEQAFGIPTYAIIPFVQSQREIQRAISRGKSGPHILAVRDSNNAAIEALRSLRSSLHFAMLEATNNVVLFTGPTPGLGKSFVAINLGVVLAVAGKRVVVIDADLRRGHLHRYVGMDSKPGLSDYISGTADDVSILRDTEVENLHFISGGSTAPNPSELLMHDKFAALIQSLSARFDYVLIDSPPVLPVADAMIIGRVAATVLVVLKSAEHPMHVIEETLRRLQRSNVKTKGIIFNQVGIRPGSYGYGGYGYDYSSEYRAR